MDLGWAARTLRLGGKQIFGRSFTKVEVAGARSRWPAKYKVTTDHGEVLYANELKVLPNDTAIAATQSARVISQVVASGPP